jgi:hypothetical protein
MRISGRLQFKNARVSSEGDNSSDENNMESVPCGLSTFSIARTLRVGKIDGSSGRLPEQKR